MSTKVSSYICKIIKKWKIIPNIINVMHDINTDGFSIMYFKSAIPDNDPLQQFYIQKIKYLTFCFLIFVDYPDDVFMVFSDNDIHKEAQKKGSHYINHYTPCIFGSNKIPIGNGFCCKVAEKNNDAFYINIDWYTGIPKAFEPEDIKEIK